MRLYLVRHAHAGDRSSGHHDIYRPLSPKGHRRAESIADLLAATGVRRILSSPATRCVQTVEPLASRLGLEVEEHPDLWEGSERKRVMAVLGQGEVPMVACSHGDIVPGVIEKVIEKGATSTGRGCEKGSIWVLDHNGRKWIHATYLDRRTDRLPDQHA